ncbi:MAG TPA: SCO family protein [Methylocystis sp.]|nr:SCO family protein [Methylocystis sp.]
MNERRKFLAGLSVALPAIAVGAHEAKGEISKGHGEGHQMVDRSRLMGKSQFPEAEVETHEGAKLKLYADLVRGKVVVFNFMTIANEAQLPLTAKLAEVAKLLGDRMEKEARILSVTGDPENDTAERLRAFAQKFEAPEGWYFLRATPEDNAQLAARFYRHGRDTRRAATLDIVQYGNDAVGLWGAFPSSVTAEDAASRVKSVMNGKQPTGELVQAGPRILGAAGPSFNNRAL